MKVCCVFSFNYLIEAILMSTHNISYQYKKENHPKLSQNRLQLYMQLWDFVLLEIQERVRNSHG